MLSTFLNTVRTSSDQIPLSAQSFITSSIGWAIRIPGSVVFGPVQHHFGRREDSLRIIGGRGDGCEFVSVSHDTLAEHQNLNAWTLALVTIAMSSLLVWPNATDQTLIVM